MLKLGLVAFALCAVLYNSEALPKKVKSSMLIFAGTKWCGHRNIAKSYNDLGKYRRTDKCCRHHDKRCRWRLRPMQTLHGLRNWSGFTSSHCSCEVTFKKCLRKVNNHPSSAVMYIYFKFLKPRCFRIKIVTKRVCIKRRWLRCTKYKIVKRKKAYFVPLNKAVAK
uniref:PLA2 PA3A/PA3B/PA5 n=1 Tax=Nemopilema nomurai TaxID=321803 RepID=A0A1D8GZE4_9CNID|nr:phospholipase A2 PA3A/PA3B/PA5 [Nemopilema nomurai]AOT85614.1 PLA2 PA3A/PA3B/PA5 [Nemopilema nomurai]